MRKAIFLFLLLIFSAVVGRGLYYCKDGFSLRRIHPLNAIAAEITPDTKDILKQSFYYLGRGRQCFAFTSEDGKYVLKLPRTDIYKIPLWLRALPLKKMRQKWQERRIVREKFLLESLHLAFNELRTQTAIIGMHIGKSLPRGEQITLIDAAGCKHILPTHNTTFLLQYKKPLLSSAFLTALKAGDRKQAEAILQSMVHVIQERASKGILNRDRSFLRNYGYDGEKAYQIDVGSFFRTEGNVYRKSIQDSLDPVCEWLSKIDPTMNEFVSGHIPRG